MAKFEKPKKGGGGNDDSPPPPTAFEVVVPQCPVCIDERRPRMDYLLAMRTPYKEMERLFPPINYRSFSNHTKKHLRYEDASVKQIIEYEAGLAGESLEAGIRGGFLRRSALDISIKKFFDALTAGDIPIEAGDVIKMIELREKLDASSASAQIEQYELQFNAFKEALEEICPPEMLAKILDLTKAKLQIVDSPAIQPPKDE
jgi:hypothetical protein